MNIKLSLLEKLIELPTSDTHELQSLFIELGIGEVTGVSGEGAERVFTVETLAHRGDHLCALGIAREFAARALSTIKQPQISQDLSDRKPSFTVKNHTDKCGRYALMELQLPAAMTLRDDIARVLGPREEGRHAIFDVLQYIKLELGQPLHAFDREKVEGEVLVVLSEAEEEIEAPGGKCYRVPAGSILIRDRKKTIAVGGVIGCANSMCTPSTTRALIEAAAFDPVCVRRTARAMGVSTGAAELFARGSDRETVLTALKRLVYLTSGAVHASESAHSLGYHYLPGPDSEPRKIDLHIAQVRREMNLPRLPAVEIITRLKYLGYLIDTVEPEKVYRATVPSWRLWSVFHESAIVEDFVRAHGLNRAKLELPPVEIEHVEPHPHAELLAALEPVLRGNGFNEVITKPCYAAEDVQTLAELDAAQAAQHLALENARDPRCSHLKVTNALHLARVCEQNLRRGTGSCKVYETSHLFTGRERSDGDYQFEYDALTLAASGRWHLHDWRAPETGGELLRLFQGVIESLGAALEVSFVRKESKLGLLHPGRQALVSVGRTICGFFGELHPRLAERLGLSQAVLYAELELEKLLKVRRPQAYRSAGEFPPVYRELTFELPPQKWAGGVVKLMRELQPAQLAAIDIVDEQKQPGEDLRRLTYRLTFRSAERALEPGEVEESLRSVISGLREQHGLELVSQAR